MLQISVSCSYDKIHIMPTESEKNKGYAAEVRFLQGICYRSSVSCSYDKIHFMPTESEKRKDEIAFFLIGL